MVQKHRRIARWTFPIWMYVSVTGVLVYLFLYQFSPFALRHGAETSGLRDDTS